MESSEPNTDTNPDRTADVPKDSDRTRDRPDGQGHRLPLSRRGALASLVGLGGLSVLSGSAQAAHRGPHWRRDVDADGNRLLDLGALAMRDDPTEIADFAGSNLSIDDNVLNARDTRTNVSDGGDQVIANATNIDFGSNLDVSDDGEGGVTVSSGSDGHTYKTGTFETKDATWDAITGLSGETPVEVTVDTNDVTSGRISVDVDGSREAEVGGGEVLHRIVGPTNSVTIGSSGEFAFDTSFDISGQDRTPTGLTFRSDGTKMFVSGARNDNIYSYTLSTAWDLSTASFHGSFSVSGQDGRPTDVAFKSDGTKMFVSGATSESIHSYTLTSWDLSTASVHDSFDVSGRDSHPSDVTFRDDGTKMFVSGSSNDNVYSYSLSTPWNLSTASFEGAFDVSGQDGTPTGVTFRNDGTEMFLTGFANGIVFSYTLSTAWDPSTATFDTSFDVFGEDTRPHGLAFESDGTKLFVVGNTTENVYSYVPTLSGTAYASVQKE